MNVIYDAYYKSNSNSHFTVNEPNQCPCCKHSLKPTKLFCQVKESDFSETFMYVGYLCTNCNECFICRFSELVELDSVKYKYKFNKLDSIAPNKFESKTFEKFINDVSPEFVKIYNQALEAEHYNLDQIAGIGYRKSLEFLIKDFLINHEHIEQEKVISSTLGNCIDTMINNPQLKLVASRATWLGNDQTHYHQKYTDNDVVDLKKLIDLSVHWISMIYLTDDAAKIEKK